MPGNPPSGGGGRQIYGSRNDDLASPGDCIVAAVIMLGSIAVILLDGITERGNYREMANYHANQEKIQAMLEKHKRVVELGAYKLKGFEQDPKLQTVLGMPNGSSAVGEGPARIIETPVQGENAYMTVPVLKNYVDLIGIRVGDGYFWGRPFEKIEIKFTGEEMRILESGGSVNYSVVGASSAADNPVSLCAKGSFRGRFVKLSPSWKAANSVGD